MREIPYTSKLDHTENGKPLALDYFVLATGGDNEPEQYGVRIVEKASGEQALAFRLTTNLERIYELMEKLSRNSVTPVGLEDVLEDWL